MLSCPDTISSVLIVWRHMKMRNPPCPKKALGSALPSNRVYPERLLPLTPSRHDTSAGEYVSLSLHDCEKQHSQYAALRDSVIVLLYMRKLHSPVACEACFTSTEVSFVPRNGEAKNPHSSKSQLNL